jgi:glycosyltransferase involved in cell wall biosynthesis
MAERRYRVLLIATHAVQYSSPSFREMARHPRLDIQVAYLNLQKSQGAIDEDFGVEVKWDVPLFEGYPWTDVPNRARRPSLDKFFGLVNPALWTMIRTGNYDAVVIYTGYRCASFWFAMFASKLSGTPIFFGADATGLKPRLGGAWKARVKHRLWPFIFGLADQVIVPSTGTFQMMRSLGIPADRISLTPYVVDNDWWKAQAAQVERLQVRAAWQIPPAAPVILFCAKLQPWKRPLDLLRAFAKSGVANTFLVFAGEGPLKPDLQREAETLGVANRVRFLGFMNQTQLPAVYCASDLFILPSEYDAFGVVVNESMLCGCAVAVSDHVGAGPDLVHKENGFIFPTGDVEALAALIREAVADPEKLRQMGLESKRIMQTWSLRENTQGLIDAIDRVVARRQQA